MAHDPLAGDPTRGDVLVAAVIEGMFARGQIKHPWQIISRLREIRDAAAAVAAELDATPPGP